jgi:hypothetical protein
MLRTDALLSNQGYEERPDMCVFLFKAGEPDGTDVIKSPDDPRREGIGRTEPEVVGLP